MNELRDQFESAVHKVENAPDDGDFQPSNDFKLNMYALFKQASIGDVQGKKPGMLDLVGRAKYTAWGKLKGMSSEEAMRLYIEEVAKVESQFG